MICGNSSAKRVLNWPSICACRNFLMCSTLSNDDETLTFSRGSLLNRKVRPSSLSTTNDMIPRSRISAILICMGTTRGLLAAKIYGVL